MITPDAIRMLSGAAALALVTAACSGCSGGGTAHTTARSSATGALARAGVGSTGETPALLKAEPNNDEELATYGHEASPAEASEVTSIVERYFAAAAAGDGRAACAYLYRPLAHSVPEDYGTSPPGQPYARGKTCAVVLTKVFKHQPGPLSALAVSSVTAVRVYGNHGFAEMSSKLTPNGAIFLEHESAGWRIGALVDRSRSGSGPE